MLNVTPEKKEKMALCSNEDGIIAAIAIDQRNSLHEMFNKENGSYVDPQALIEFKNEVSEVLTPFASAILLDTSFGLDAITHKAPGTGVLLTYDRSGYDNEVKGRIPRLLPNWSVSRLVKAGADAIKVMIYYDIEDGIEINTIKHAFVERIGAECDSYQVPFFLEPICYSQTIEDKKSIEFAKVKPEKVIGIMKEFSQPQYQVDVLKVEPPISLPYVKGSSENNGNEFVYSYETTLDYFRKAGEQSRVPFIFLSAGVSTSAFHEILKMAGESGTGFSGVLCGRTTWQGGIKPYLQGGKKELRAWLSDEGVRIISELNTSLKKYAKPWYES